MKYQVVIKHHDGTCSVLLYKHRTSWALRTARKHKADIATKIARGEWDYAEFCMLVPS